MGVFFEPSKRMRSAMPSSNAAADRARGFGSDVALGDAGAAGGRDQAGLAGQANDCLLNGGLIVGHDFGGDYRKILALEDFRDRWSGKIGALAAG